MKITDVFSLAWIAGAATVRVTALDNFDQVNDLLMMEDVQSFLRCEDSGEAIVNQQFQSWARELLRPCFPQVHASPLVDLEGDELLVAQLSGVNCACGVKFYLVQIGPHARSLEFIMDSPEVQMGHWYLIHKS